MALPDIEAKVIHHDSHRYPTVGDWTVDLHGTRHFRISDMGDADYEFMVLIHEMVEQHLCQKRGVTTEMVDEFDMQFEIEREQGIHDKDAEPGDSPIAPYYQEHQFATKIEREICSYLGIDWDKYNNFIGEL